MAKRAIPRKWKKIRNLKETQYLVFRSSRTNKIVKYRAGRQYIVEVRDRKSKRLQGYLNVIEKKGKKKKILPRKFTKAQLKIRARRKVRGVRQEKAPDSFQVEFSKPLVQQFQKAGKRAVQKALDEIELNGEQLLGVEGKTARDVIRTDMKLYSTSENLTRDELALELAIRLINALRGEAIRTSIKKFSSKPNRRFYRKAMVTIMYGRLGF